MFAWIFGKKHEPKTEPIEKEKRVRISKIVSEISPIRDEQKNVNIRDSVIKHDNYQPKKKKHPKKWGKKNRSVNQSTIQREYTLRRNDPASFLFPSKKETPIVGGKNKTRKKR